MRGDDFRTCVFAIAHALDGCFWFDQLALAVCAPRARRQGSKPKFTFFDLQYDFKIHLKFYFYGSEERVHIFRLKKPSLKQDGIYKIFKGDCDLKQLLAVCIV